MLTSIILFIGYICLSVLLTSMTTPIEDLKKKIGLHYTDEPTTYLKKSIRDLFNCEYCFGFWLGILIYHSVPLAALLSIGAHLLYKLLNK